MEDESSTLFTKFYKGDVISTLRSLWMDDTYKDVMIIRTSQLGQSISGSVAPRG